MGMKRNLIRNLAGVLALCCPAACLHAQQVSLKYWKAEDHSGQMSIEVAGDTLDIVSPKGVTLWYTPRLTGHYEIAYRACVLMQGGACDRLSDLNCFWGANDPQHPGDLYARAGWRMGIFQRYKSLTLMYVGYGGNHNSTTRFREYFGQGMDTKDDVARPVIKEYTDEAHLLKPNRWMNIRIRVEEGVTTYSVDGEELFRYAVKEGQCDGNFGLRLLENHVQVTGFRVKKID